MTGSYDSNLLNDAARDAVRRTMENEYAERLDCFVRAVFDEVHRAREKFPGNSSQVTVFFEEAGEVAKALLDHERGEEPPKGVYDECVQAAAMAARVALEGSAEFPYDPRDVDLS